MKCSSRLEPEHSSDVQNAYRVWKSPLNPAFLHPRGPTVLFPPRSRAPFSRSTFRRFAYAVKRLETQRQSLTFEFCTDSRSVFLGSLPTSSSAQCLRSEVWTSLVSIFFDLPCKGGTAVHFCDILQLISRGFWKGSRSESRSLFQDTWAHHHCRIGNCIFSVFATEIPLKSNFEKTLHVSWLFTQNRYMNKLLLSRSQALVSNLVMPQVHFILSVWCL